MQFPGIEERVEILDNKKAGAAAPASLDEAEEFLKFTDSEVSKMPKEFRKYFRYGGKKHRIRQKKNGIYEIRFMIKGLKISASAKTIEVAKKKFIALLNDAIIVKPPKEPKKTVLKDFAQVWLETVKRPNVKNNTYEDYERQFRLHILPFLGDRYISEIKALDIHALLNVCIKKENFRTAEKLHGILHDFFESACNEDIISQNPMKKVPQVNYSAEEGVPLTVEEEKYLITQLFATEHPCRYAIIFLLYTGMRRTELKTAVASENWITVITAKTRKGIVKKRKFPISPMLRPYMDYFNEENLLFKEDRLSRVIPKFLPEHHLHELRHTFITRAQECGIPKPLVQRWAGHTPNKHDMTESVYTHFSDEYQLKEIQKYNY